MPVETPIIGRGSLVADHGHYVDVEGRLEDLDLQPPVEPVGAGGDADASRGERNVAGGCQRSRRRHRELDEAELRHGGSIVERCSR